MSADRSVKAERKTHPSLRRDIIFIFREIIFVQNFEG